MFDAFFRKLIVPAETKIAMLILDGLGGLPLEPGGKTELEIAKTPNLDALAARSALGLSVPVGPGVAAGSGPGHLAIFGYDPIEYEIGRGALEALGVDFELGPDDIAARGNFCTVDETGILTDRRAGRLPSEASLELIHLLRGIRIEGADFFVEPVKEHRFAWIMRARGLGAALTDTDPQTTGVKPPEVRALDERSQKAADLINQFIQRAGELLAGRTPANWILLRGFARLPEIPSYQEMFKLRAAAIAVNGMYRGVARLAGMEVLPLPGAALADEFTALERHWKEYDFFYLHYKKTDTCGESGDFAGKVRAIEDFDAQLPRLLALEPDVIIVGGDHSSPAALKAHSWHPVPLLLYGKYVRADGIAEFGESACARGSLGQIPARQVMPLALANAGRVAKYGA
jgi:2,3-bisphosphoglycerate-independent phosphoglycerate mutase